MPWWCLLLALWWCHEIDQMPWWCLLLAPWWCHEIDKVRCHGGIPEMVSSNFHGTPPIWLFHPGTNMFCGVWHFTKQSVAVWIVLDGVQDYETKCASSMSDGKSWKPIEDFGCSFWCLLPLNLGAFKPKRTWPKNQDFVWPYPCKAQGVETPSWQRAPLRSGLVGYLNLHCCMTLSQHHECMTPSRHQCCDTI